ncbi:MAG: ribokinase [Oscillospiraceae bacterium]|nr:ribokinase [Oscillospiraceae bacterium]
MSKVAVFGSFVADLMARSPRMPGPGETVRGLLFRMGPGGKGFNQGVAAHKAGADVTMITKLGRDSFADAATGAMRSLGMREDHLLFSQDAATGAALILVDERTGENEIVVVPGACDTITAQEVAAAEDVIAACDYVLLQLEINQDANEAVAALACRHGCRVILNPAPYAEVGDDFLSRVYMATPNEVEAEAMTGIPITDFASAQKAAARLFSKGIRHVVITLGARGVFISSDGVERILPAFPVNAVDTTGAGDAFNGGLLAGLAEGMDIWQAARFASALAALSVQKLGTTPSMPARAEIDAFLALAGGEK